MNLFLGTISINTLRTAYTAPGESEILDLDDNLYLGGLPENKMGLVFPTEVWTALLNYGYVGCIRDLFIDGQSKDVRRLAEVQKATGVKPSCSKEPPKQCLSNPCQNNGVCREGWNRYVCDCSGTGYLGRSCERGRTRFLFSSLTLSFFSVYVHTRWQPWCTVYTPLNKSSGYSSFSWNFWTLMLKCTVTFTGELYFFLLSTFECIFQCLFLQNMLFPNKVILWKAQPMNYALLMLWFTDSWYLNSKLLTFWHHRTKTAPNNCVIWQVIAMWTFLLCGISTTVVCFCFKKIVKDEDVCDNI